MRDDEPPGQGQTRLPREAFHHMLAIQSVKAIAAIALRGKSLRQWQPRHQVRIANMERRIKTRQMQKPRHGRTRGRQRIQPERHVQGGKLA